MASLQNIYFTGDKAELHQEMLKEFKLFGRKALTMNHYDFAEVSQVTDDPQEWKAFLQIEAISEYITEEFNAIQDSELRKLILDVNNSSSVGKAQLIGALQKQLKESANDQKVGPAFIYTYVPLNPKEQNAENVEVLKDDPFRKST